MIDTNGKFYLGRIFDPEGARTTPEPLLYKPDDLTTHAVVVGMTGSGKTGLCLTLMEEAALNGIPALMIDPKGDITNALLHFPGLAPQDFLPWVNPDEARRQGQSVEEAAAQAAERWRAGLAEWDIPQERVQALAGAAQFAIYTPGSDAGLPVSILASLQAPDIPWQENRELLREKISGTVTALLGLVGMGEIDPVRSREHILLANIFEHAWSQGKDLDLGELILQTQSPPFEKLGVFDVNTFFPEKDRFGLAMLLNNMLASPSFAGWIQGQPLDVASLLYTPEGRPRHSIFYIAHLSDAERMFFVTLLYSAVESWMRAQTGTPSLRAIVYFDEIHGYLPPVANPPSKGPMLRMLKQARAFGVAQVLATQNPVDVDYKALSNAGTWFIGKLQTEQDKARLLDGLESAAPGGLNRAAYDRVISALGKRVFLLHNIHAKGGQLFQTRQALNYLAGPLTRAQIPALNALAGASAWGAAAPARPAPASPPVEPPPAEGDTRPVRAAAPSPAPAAQRSAAGSTTRPPLPGGVREYFLPPNLDLSGALQAAGRQFSAQAQAEGLVYRPALLAQAEVRYANRKYNLDTAQVLTALAREVNQRGLVRWEEYQSAAVDAAVLESRPAAEARFEQPGAPLNDPKALSTLEKDFQEWAYRTARVAVRANEALKVYAGPEVSQAEFRRLCAEAAREGRDAEAGKISAAFDKKRDSLETKLQREERELEEDQEELDHRKWEERGSLFETGAGFLGLGRKRSVTSHLSKRRMTEKAKADVKESEEAIKAMRRELEELEKEHNQALEEVNARWSEIADNMTEIPVTPYKKDVLVELFGVAWVPYYQVRAGSESLVVPAYRGVE